MKIHPVNIEIEYASGRTESKVIKNNWPKWEKDLKEGVKMGIIKSYTAETHQDRENKRGRYY